MRIPDRSDMKLSEFQEKVLLGTLMGDTTLYRNPSGTTGVHFCQNEKQLGYLKEKGKIFKEFINSEPKVNNVQRRKSGESTVAYELYTITAPCFSDVYDLVYVNRRRSFTEVQMEKLGPESLAFWYFDDGGLQGRDMNHKNLVRISCCSRSKDEMERVGGVLEQRFGIKTRIWNSCRGPILGFSVGDSKKFLELVTPYCPSEDVCYKLEVNCA